jgi:hypothetical protein
MEVTKLQIEFGTSENGTYITIDAAGEIKRVRARSGLALVTKGGGLFLISSRFAALRKQMAEPSSLLVGRLQANTYKEWLAAFNGPFNRLCDCPGYRIINVVRIEIDGRVHDFHLFNRSVERDQARFESLIEQDGYPYLIQANGEGFIIYDREKGVEHRSDILEFRLYDKYMFFHADLTKWRKKVDEIQHHIDCWRAKLGLEKYEDHAAKSIAGYEKKLARFQRRLQPLLEQAEK